jgi:AbrB family looped-hinge helix DNA binding protein
MSYKIDATLTSKGQVTIPAGIRERLGVKAGDQLRFHLEDTGLLTVTPIRRRSIFERLDELKLPSIGRPTAKEDIATAIDQEVATRQARFGSRRRR